MISLSIIVLWIALSFSFWTFREAMKAIRQLGRRIAMDLQDIQRRLAALEAKEPK